MRPLLLSRLLVWPALLAGGPGTLPAVPQQANQAPQYIEKSYPVVAGNEWPDKNSQMQMHQKQAAKKNFEAANIERRHQIETDSEQLLQLAKDLKAAVDRADEGTPDLIRRAELIEKLAHGVKEKMKLTVSGS
jgi:hypothetical protein